MSIQSVLCPDGVFRLWHPFPRGKGKGYVIHNNKKIAGTAERPINTTEKYYIFVPDKQFRQLFFCGGS